MKIHMKISSAKWRPFCPVEMICVYVQCLFSWSGAVFEIEMSPLSHQTCKDLTIYQTSCLPHETETIKDKTRLYIPLRPCAGTSQIPMFFAHFRCSLGASLIFTNIRTMGFLVILTLFLTVQICKKSDIIHVQHKLSVSTREAIARRATGQHRKVIGACMSGKSWPQSRVVDMMKYSRSHSLNKEKNWNKNHKLLQFVVFVTFFRNEQWQQCVFSEISISVAPPVRQSPTEFYNSLYITRELEIQ